MATGVISWSQTAGNNTVADSSINWQEGQAPSTVNDSARAMMASVAKWRDDNTGKLVTGGTTTAYTVTSNQGFSSLATMDGQTLRLNMNATCGAAPTLAVDSLTAKAIVYANGSAVGSGDLVLGHVYGFVYDNGNGVWIVHGGGSAFATGTLMLFQQTAAPTGWTKQTTHNDKALRVVSGTASSGGSTAFSSIMASRTITQGNLPSYTLPNTLGVSQTNGSSFIAPTSLAVAASAGVGTGSATFYRPQDYSSIVLSESITGSVTSGGSGTAMDFAVAYVDLIIAAKA